MRPLLDNRLVSMRPTVQILSGILLDAGEGRLALAATDMELSLLAPLSWEVGFLETSAEQAAARFARWRRQLGPLEERDIHGDLPALLCGLSPVTDGEPNRFLFVGTDGDWTAFFDNLAYGTDSFGPMSVLARDLRVRAVKARWVPDAAGSPAERRGSVIFEQFGAEETAFLNTERVVAVMHDGDRWTFDEVGTPLPFEHLDA
jgi:hypothetical protein